MAEGGGLLNRYRVVKPYRGFESLCLRHPLFRSNALRRIGDRLSDRGQTIPDYRERTQRRSPGIPLGSESKPPANAAAEQGATPPL